MTSRTIGLFILLALSGLAATGWAAPGDRKSIQLRGRITDERGAPLAEATVTATGVAVLSGVANTDGRYLLTLELGTVADLKRHPATWRIEAKHKGKRVPVAGGTERFEFTVLGDSIGQVLASANLPALGAELNRELGRPGTVVANVTLDFTRARPGKSAAGDSAKVVSAAAVPVAATTTTSKGAAPPKESVKPAAGKKPKAGALTAAEVLEASKPHDTSKAMADSMRAALKEAAQREQAAQRDSVRAAQRTRDSLATVARAQQEALAEALRDSVRAMQRANDSQREVLRMEEVQRMIFRRDSSVQAMRTRDSVKAVTRARTKTQDSLRAVARRDSLRATKPPLVLDPRPPVGGKPVGPPPAVVVVDAAPKPGGTDDAPPATPQEPATPCECRVRGTIEVRSEKPLASPLSIVVGIKGQPTMKATVQLFMGSPRGFVFTHVPCGALQLEMTIPEGRRFAIADAQTLGPYTCTRSGQWQPRLVLSPN